MIEIIEGDLLESDADYICHQVNCLGVMGSGIALQIRDKYPNVYKEYANFCKIHENSKSMLGHIQCVPVSETQSIVNIFGQHAFGRNAACYTDLDALKFAFTEISHNLCEDPSKVVAVPYRIGCGLGKGDWGKVMDILADAFARKTLLIYRYNPS